MGPYTSSLEKKNCIPDTMSCTNQFVPDLKEIVTNLYQTISLWLLISRLVHNVYLKFC